MGLYGPQVGPGGPKGGRGGPGSPGGRGGHGGHKGNGGTITAINGSKLSLRTENGTETVDTSHQPLENAQKYTPEHTEIALRVTKTNTRVELSVADQGPGIPSAERQKVFERFYRGDPARSRATGGAGLGLAIVADHEGAVHGHDNPGGGTKIVLDLPLAPSPPRPELTS